MAQCTRYPNLVFISCGPGNVGDGMWPQPFETVSYDAALLRSKIHFNVIPYISALPRERQGYVVPVDNAFHRGSGDADNAGASRV